MDAGLKAMIAAQILVAKMNTGLKPVAGSPLIKEAVDFAEAIADEIDSREKAPAPAAAPDPAVTPPGGAPQT